MRPLTIAIDPVLTQSFGHQICWTWRTLLTGMGFAWNEVDLDTPGCDLAYVTDATATSARLVIRADVAKWKAGDAPRLIAVDRSGPLQCLRYSGEPSNGPIVADQGRLIFDRDVIFDVFWLATGQAERGWRKGAHGIFDLDQEPAVTRDVLRDAVASAVGCGLERLIREVTALAPLDRWPNGKRLAACVGHDVDYPEVIRLLEPVRVLARQGLAGARNAWAVAVGSRHHWHFGSWLKLEESLGVRSAFYFVPRRGSLIERALGTPDPFYDIRDAAFQSLFRDLRARGVEIGLHASYRAYEDPDGIKQEKERLEEAAGIVVAGNRHHYWHLNPDDPAQTLRHHERAGLEYDASLFHDRYIGWRRGFTWPFFPFDEEERRTIRTLQIPTGWMDDQLFGLKRHNPGDRTSILQELVDQVAAQQGCFMIDVHEYVFDPALFPGWAAAYKFALERLVERGDVWFATPSDVAKHWQARTAGLLAASRGLTDAACRHLQPTVH